MAEEMCERCGQPVKSYGPPTCEDCTLAGSTLPRIERRWHHLRGPWTPEPESPAERSQRRRAVRSGLGEEQAGLCGEQPNALPAPPA